MPDVIRMPERRRPTKVLVTFEFKRPFGLRDEIVEDSIMLEVMSSAEIGYRFADYVTKRLADSKRLPGRREYDFAITQWLAEHGKAKF